MSTQEITVAKNGVKVTTESKTDSLDIEITKAIGLGDGLDRKRDTEGRYRREWPEQVDK